jgi:hypothetical protein
MKCGIYVPNCWSFGSVAALRRLALEAENAGWDGFFVWDHLLIAEDIPVIDSVVALAAIAGSTSADGPLGSLGALITPLGRRRPWKFAREMAALQELSQGRLVVGAGLGQPPEYTFASIEAGTPQERALALDDALELLGEFWSGKAFGWQRPSARHGDSPGAPTVDASPFLPAPSPIPPIWIGGCVYRDDPGAAQAPSMSSTEYVPQVPERSVKQPTRPFRRAARHQGLFPVAMPWENSAPLTADELESAVRIAFQGESPPVGFDIVTTGRATGAEPPTTAEELARIEAVGATWWLEAPPDLASLDEALALIQNGPPRPRADAT